MQHVFNTKQKPTVKVLNCVPKEIQKKTGLMKSNLTYRKHTNGPSQGSCFNTKRGIFFVLIPIFQHQHQRGRFFIIKNQINLLQFSSYLTDLAAYYYFLFTIYVFNLWWWKENGLHYNNNISIRQHIKM